MLFNGTIPSYALKKSIDVEFKRVIRRISYLLRLLKNLFILFTNREMIKKIFAVEKKSMLRLFLMTKLTYEAIAFSIDIKNDDSQSYSSDFQDQFVLYYMRVMGLKVSDSFYIDVGAFDGHTKSNSKKLELAGMAGILIEPNPKAFDLLSADRQAITENVGLIPSHNQNDKYHFMLSGEKGITSYLKTQSHLDVEFPHVETKVLSVENFLSKYNTLLFDYRYIYLSIDVEGLDFDLLYVFFELGFFPTIVSIEHNHDKNTIIEIKKLANKYNYIIQFSGFFRNDYILVRNIS